MPAGIIIVGLGPGSSEQWTLSAYHLLTQADEIYARTARHPSIADIPAPVINFDDWYEQGSDFAQTDIRVAAEIVRLGRRDNGVVYAVPGHPDLGEATVPHIRRLARAKKLPVTIIPGLSFFEATFTALEAATPANLQLVDASQVASRHHPPLEPDRAALITRLHGQKMTRQVKRALLNAYNSNFTITLVQAAGAAAQRVWHCPLAALDSQPWLDKMLTSLYLPAATSLAGFSTFQETIAHLRAPDGCPWDREQTHQSLRPFLLEETYEVLEALDAGDPQALAEELGDLLLQIVLHTQVAIDAGEFNMGAVIDHINRKLVRRHPHVFGSVQVNGVADVTANWESIKRAEKAAKGQNDSPASALDGVPAALPALAQALAISKRAARVGFEWPNIEGVLEKIIEEAREIVEARDDGQLESEIGDLLFSVVNLARWRQVDPESALRATNARFRRRFNQMEALAQAQGRSLAGMSIAEMDELWNAAKQQES